MLSHMSCFGSCILLFCVAPADGPRNISIVSVSNSTAILKWEEPGTPNGEIIGYHLSYAPGEVILTVGKVPYVELEDLTPFTEYTLLISASTKGGVGPASASVFRTLEGGQNLSFL